MADETEFGANVAESTVAYDDFVLDPGHYSDTGQEPSSIWGSAQRLRELVDQSPGSPSQKDRDFLILELGRQVRSLLIFVEVIKNFIHQGPPADHLITLLVLLFPGEAKDNTGIKELNDKVLGYRWNSEYITARQAVIEKIFTGGGNPGYLTVGQDYKSAYILARGKKPADTAKDLVTLDGQLATLLLGFLDKAEPDAQAARDQARVAEIRKLRKALRKKNYRFDYLFGTNSQPAVGKPLEVTFLLITEALKAAGVARFVVKGKSLKQSAAQLMAGRAIPRLPKGHDDRGQPFEAKTYLRVSEAAPDIKKHMLASPNQDQTLDLYYVYVNTVWTVTFLPHKQLDFGNPDVIRDVRKKALKPPKARDGVHYGFEAQRELLELWLVTLNLIDYVRDFLTAEFEKQLFAYHVQAAAVLAGLQDPAQQIDWKRLTPLLTRDARQKSPIAVLGAASEFLFYSFAADHPHQVFFVMDIRDLGVDLMLYYELTNKRIVDNKLTEIDLMLETLRSTDPTIERKRATYDQVVEVFRAHHNPIHAGALSAAQKAFGATVSASGPMPAFDQSLRLMVGGDEIFVAAHPLYAEHVPDIIRQLDGLSFGDQLLNMRVGVAYSAARLLKATGAASGATSTPEQRRANQTVHDQALKLASSAPNVAKPFERSHSRIERLIDKLENSANPKKQALAKGYTEKLTNLHLLEMFGRVNHAHAQPRSGTAYARLTRALREENLAAAKAVGDFELVDFAGQEIDGDKLAKQADDLEAAVRRDVFPENFHGELPPVNKIPKWVGWVEKAIEHFFPIPSRSGSGGSRTA